MFASRFSEADIARAVAAFRSGVRPLELCRDLGVSERTLYRWRRHLDGATPVAPAQGPSTRTRLFAVVGDVFLLCTPIAGPMPLAQARMDWNDEPVPEPIVFSIVGDPEQGWHLIALAREPAGAGGDHAPRIEVRSAADEIVCRIEGAGREPLVPGDRTAVLARLPDAVRHRVLRVLVETGGTFLRLHDDLEFVRVCRQLVLATMGTPQPWTTALSLGGRMHYCVGPSRRDADDVRAVLLIGARTVRRNAFLPQRRTGAAGGPAAIQLVIDRAEALGPGRVLVVCIGSGAPECFVLDPDTMEPPTALHHHLQEQGDEAFQARGYLLRCLRPYLRASAPLRALLRESLLLLPPVAAPTAAGRPLAGEIDLAVPVGDGGLLVRGWLADPQQIVEELQVVSAFDEVRSIDPRRHAFVRPQTDQRARSPGEQGFVAFLPELSPLLPEAPARLRARLASGAMVELPATAPVADRERARSELLGAVPPQAITEAMLTECLAPAIAAVQAEFSAGIEGSRIERIGRPPEAVDWSIVVPLYRSLELLPAQYAAFAADPDMARAELILVLDSPEQEEELRRALHGLELIYGLAATLVVNRRNLGYAGAVNAGAAVARGKWLALCNSDVVPAAPGWLSAMRRGLQPGIGVVGPMLLFPDDTIQHAGMYFDQGVDGRWLNRHFFKGHARGTAAAGLAREVPAVTGGCMLLLAQTFERLGGLSTDYVIGDYEDSDLCLRLRAAGLRPWYAPDAVLYHLERHSIQRHPGYQRGVAAHYNRWLHGRRWSRVMAALMDDRVRWGLPSRQGWRPEPPMVRSGEPVEPAATLVA